MTSDHVNVIMHSGFRLLFTISSFLFTCVSWVIVKSKFIVYLLIVMDNLNHTNDLILECIPVRRVLFGFETSECNYTRVTHFQKKYKNSFVVAISFMFVYILPCLLCFGLSIHLWLEHTLFTHKITNKINVLQLICWHLQRNFLHLQNMQV